MYNEFDLDTIPVGYLTVLWISVGLHFRWFSRFL